MLRNFIKKSNNTEIITVKQVNSQNSTWGGNGVVFCVKNGNGLLFDANYCPGNHLFSTLVYGNTPLIKFCEDMYRDFCPDIEEKLVSAGYGLNMSEQLVISELRGILNSKFISLEQSVEALKPLLGLLPTGYYALVDTELCPTDGNGEFFWKLNNKPTYNKASRRIRYEDGTYSEGFPYYILPTQPPSHYNPKQAEFYRDKDDYRALAYYMAGYLCVLIDGHHKAVAAAMDKKKVKTLVIVPTRAIVTLNDDMLKRGIYIGRTFFGEKELTIIPFSKIIKLFGSCRIEREELEKYMSMCNRDFDQYYDWPPEILEAEKTFPDVITVARQQWAQGISDNFDLIP
ncbi:hypothetical protein [Acetivibrio mesophilus]|uniref:Uncharacterized protein n=1 Tax=Acetivibrio mesophilus TaxID=2487273 RepID=A0A4Q0I9D3_9FIRM|nr:hypothetical protein [Acetivibrio mesophilus]ODM26355.1 hypothetical protein A7W90_09050 [Clostridium sp. Bc-iso-3]RXE60585.1 hypothetical protein EFD62_01240 [Acetivibrio mesophilus]HHV30351.1 hypothetical protein [Clostridium sp.]